MRNINNKLRKTIVFKQSLTLDQKKSKPRELLMLAKDFDLHHIYNQTGNTPLFSLRPIAIRF
jgi:hypothetical protein